MVLLLHFSKIGESPTAKMGGRFRPKERPATGQVERETPHVPPSEI